jgi:RNase P subunit RPR2
MSMGRVVAFRYFGRVLCRRCFEALVERWYHRLRFFGRFGFDLFLKVLYRHKSGELPFLIPGLNIDEGKAIYCRRCKALLNPFLETSFEVWHREVIEEGKA